VREVGGPIVGDLATGEWPDIPAGRPVVKAEMGRVDPRPRALASVGRVGAGAKRFWRRFDLFFF
jgi:hypothetical protein